MDPALGFDEAAPRGAASSKSDWLGWLEFKRQSFGVSERRLTAEEKTVVENNPNLELSDLLMSVSLRSDADDEEFEIVFQLKLLSNGSRTESMRSV